MPNCLALSTKLVFLADCNTSLKITDFSILGKHAINAARTPETTGAAIDVPDKIICSEGVTFPKILVPGAVITALHCL